MLCETPKDLAVKTSCCAPDLIYTAGVKPSQLSNQSGHAQKDDILPSAVKHLTTSINQERLHGSYMI